MQTAVELEQSRHPSVRIGYRHLVAVADDWIEYASRNHWTASAAADGWIRFLSWHVPLTALDLRGCATLTGRFSEYGSLSARLADSSPTTDEIGTALEMLLESEVAVPDNARRLLVEAVTDLRLSLILR